MKKVILIFGLIIIFLLGGCAGNNALYSKKPVDDNSIAKAYLEDKGYKVISCEGNVWTYVLTKEKLKELPYAQYWKVQNVNADKFFGKTIDTIKFTVKKHPLDKYPGNKSGQTIIWVMMVDGKAIGGYSLPDIKDLTGRVFPLDGPKDMLMNTLSNSKLIQPRVGGPCISVWYMAILQWLYI